MKHLKIASYLLIMVTFLTSCEEETIGLSEASETVATKTNEMTPPSMAVDFYFNEEAFDCNNLLTQNFDAGDDSDLFPSPLNSESDDGVFSPGDILPGISFESSDGFSINYIGGSNVLMRDNYWPKSEDYGYNDIIVNFTTNTIYDVSMMLYSRDTTFHPEIEVYGFEENYLGNTTASIKTNYAGYIALSSLEEPIAQIIIRNDVSGKGDSSNRSYSQAGIGVISFGKCNGDSDDDGCLDEDDAYPNSNMSETLSLGENSYEDIDNVLVDCGTTMQDQIDNLISQINNSYDGDYKKGDGEQEDNWEELHEAFTTKLAHITYYWRINKLITAGERAEISSDAWSADIPFSDPR